MLLRPGISKEKIIIRKVRCMLNYLLNLFKAIFNNEGLKEKEEEEVKPKVDLKKMTKKQLEEYGRTLGIELDRRHTKKQLIQTLETIDGKDDNL